MATTTWRDAGSVTTTDEPDRGRDAQERWQQLVLKRLRDEGFRFDFHQVLLLLEKAFPDASAPGETHDLQAERIRVYPDPALAFPATDVKSVRVDADHDPRVTVRATFMGLYGVNAPLPEFFYEGLATEQEELLPLRDFLDIFNHRLYTAFYRSWKKYRPELRQHREGHDRDTRRFLALSGLGTRGAVEQPPVDRRLLIAFAGRLLPRTRNAEGLKALLGAYLDLPVEIEQNVPRWVAIRRRRIGEGPGMQLGRTTTIGERVFDRMGKFRIRVGPMGRDRYLGLLPQGEQAASLEWLVRTYLTSYIDFDVELRLDTADLPAARLGDPTCRLGLTACVGRPGAPMLVRVVDYNSS